MKRLLTIFIISCSTSFAQKVDLVKDLDELSRRESVNYQTFNVSKSVASGNFDLKYARCEWELDPAIRYITGKVTLYFEVTTALNSLILDLSSSLTADSVTWHDKSLATLRPNEGLQINFPGMLNSGTIDSISIYYKGIPGNTGFGSFVQDMHAGIPVIWSLSEPYGSKDWWPCKTDLGDKLDSVDVIIKHPAAYRAASNGLLQSETIIDGGTKILTHWKHRYPIASYLLCFAVTNYAVFNNSVQLDNIMLPMQTFCYPENLAVFQANTPNVLAALQLFHSKFGDYPFIKEKYGHVQFGWGGGMEHQTSTFIVWPDEGLMAHELAHQWFGDKITTHSWEDIWLNEGFATYLAAFYMENKYPATIVQNRRAVLNNITSIASGSVKVDDTTNVNRIFNGRLSYNKGSYLLNMLRFKLGDQTFFKALRQYQKDPRVSYGYARTEDLKRNLEEVSGKNLTQFFDQWYTGQGYPTYTVQWNQVGSSNVKIKINQSASHSSVPFFSMPVPLKFKNSTHEKTVIVENDFNGETCMKDIGFVADTVFVDPELWLISKNNQTVKLISSNTGMGMADIYPIPAQDPISIFLHDFESRSAIVTIFSSAGQKMYQKDVSLVNGQEIVRLQSGKWAKGIYNVKIVASGKTIVKQIIK